MKYKIIEVLPAQIKVEFEDNSWALVTISPEATPEQIDHAVAQYDPDFLPKPESLINKNIDVGVERISNPAIESKQLEPPKEEKPDQLLPIKANFGIFEIAEYFASNGDNRLKDAINNRIEAYVTHVNFSIDDLISNYINIPIHHPIFGNPVEKIVDQELSSDWQDILKQAEEELNAEQS